MTERKQEIFQFIVFEATINETHKCYTEFDRPIAGGFNHWKKYRPCNKRIKQAVFKLKERLR